MYISFLFIFSLILSTVNNIVNNTGMFWTHIIMNIVLSSIFIALYKINNTKINIEIVIGILLISWSVLCLNLYPVTLMDYVLMIVYGTMLLIKNSYGSRNKQIIIYVSVCILCMSTFIYTDNALVDVFKTILLMCIMALVHYHIYYNSYKEKPDIKKKYNLTDFEYKLIKVFVSLCETDPSNKAIAKKMNKSESHIKNTLNLIYDKFKIGLSGNKRTVLIFKLRDF